MLQFIRKRVKNVADAEDILQDVFYQFTEYLRLGAQVDSITSWLFAVTRNRITDWFRKKRESTFSDHVKEKDGEENFFLEELLADAGTGADGPMLRKLLLESIMEAIEELPEEQRTVFLQHEVEGRSFKQMSADTGVSVNTLLSRKRYAVLYLRQRLADLYQELQGN